MRHEVHPGGPKTLFIDIETSPHIVYMFGQFNKPAFISLDQVIETTRILSVAAKWRGNPETMFFSEHADGHRAMIEKTCALLDEADVVCHFYGERFDVPHINRELLAYGITPPRPFRQVDLKRAVSKRFLFPSNKLQFVSEVLGFGGKVKHEGFSMWPACMAGDPEAWARMEEYNRRDTTLLEECYESLLPWIPGLPSRHLYGGDGCPACGADKVKPSGHYHTPLSVYQQYTCSACGSHFRDSKRLTGVSLQAAAL